MDRAVRGLCFRESGTRRPVSAWGYLGLLLVSISQVGCGWILGLDEYSLRESCPVSECGVFVALEGSDINEGTKERPVRTISRAIEIAREASSIVNVCAQEFLEAIDVPAGTILKGSLNCQAEWEYIGELARTTLAPPPNLTPIRLSSGDAVTRIEDVDARAADATLPGGSSIALIADGAKAEIVRCSFTAGAGAAGANGTTSMENVGPSDSGDSAIKGANGVNACTSGETPNEGGLGATNALCDVSVGGNGGAGDVMIGADGANGQPLPEPNPEGWGLGGVGASATSCKRGEDGSFGADGAPGAGAQPLDLGLISSKGYVGATGKDGGAGQPGQGAGGGGGAKGKTGCAGASGGGGGAGGCGGNGGGGGRAGGSSIAVISLSATLTFSSVTLRAGNGGAGGDGGDGQSGGVGGAGGFGGLGMSTLQGCAGGQGGAGGLGGKGGGGRGGHSIGVAYTGKAPPSAATSLGVAGVGGLGEGDSGNGAPGEVKDSLQFTEAM
jgi:hypothetical protein